MHAGEAEKHPFSERFYGSLVLVMFHSNLDEHNKEVKGREYTLILKVSFGSPLTICVLAIFTL